MSAPLPRLWEDTVAESPSAVALVEASTGRAWTRAELAAGAAQWAVAHARPAAGSPLAGRRVAMSVPNGAEWLHVFLGLLCAGAVPAPIDPGEPEESRISAARAIGARWIWHAGRLHSLGPASPAGRRAPSECLVKMTSGSTGAPRGLSFSHAQMEADGRQVCRTMGIGPGDASLATIPLGYSYGLGNLVVPLLLQGSRVVCASSALPHAIASDAARWSPTVFPSVPAVLRALVASDVARESLASVRLVVSAGSPLAPETGRAFAAKFGKRIHSFYGASETGGIAFDRSGDATLSGRGVGTPLLGVRIRFGAGGRFVVSSPAVMGRGRFAPADRAALNEHGELVLGGRTDRVVKVAGRRLGLAEIEAAIRSLPGVRDAFAHMSAAPGAVLSAAVCADCAGTEIRRGLRSRLASWKIPSRILVLAEFPATPRGKADAGRLRQLLAAPRTATSISTLSAARQMSASR
ncbi:MAG TPA: class I adenylate-forming enzyme family protein [Opitutaceae bacterium]|nr:class I adenylate-forming enzyme family protein [Opitutaceae bacterium]